MHAIRTPSPLKSTAFRHRTWWCRPRQLFHADRSPTHDHSVGADRRITSRVDPAMGRLEVLPAVRFKNNQMTS